MRLLPPGLPGVRHAADYRAEHEGGNEGEEHQVDEAFQSVVTQTRHGLDVVLQGGKWSDQSMPYNRQLKKKDFRAEESRSSKIKSERFQVNKSGVSF